MVRKFLTGLALIVALGCGGGSKVNDKPDNIKPDVIDVYEESDTEFDCIEELIADEGLNNDIHELDVQEADKQDTPYVPDDISLDESSDPNQEEDLLDNYIPDDIQNEEPEIIEDITDSADNYIPDKLDTYEVETVDPCAPVAKACNDDYRWKESDVDLPDPSYIGKCKPVKFGLEKTYCLDFSDKLFDKSNCDYINFPYTLPEKGIYPTGSYGKCSELKTFYFGLDKKCGLWTEDSNEGIFTFAYTTKPKKGQFCIGVEDKDERISYDLSDYIVE